MTKNCCFLDWELYFIYIFANVWRPYSNSYKSKDHWNPYILVFCPSRIRRYYFQFRGTPQHDTFEVVGFIFVTITYLKLGRLIPHLRCLWSLYPHHFSKQNLKLFTIMSTVLNISKYWEYKIIALPPYPISKDYQVIFQNYWQNSLQENMRFGYVPPHCVNLKNRQKSSICQKPYSPVTE